MVFISDNFVVRNLAGLGLRHDDAVGGFFDAPQAGADNTSFEGRKQRWRDRVRALDFPHAHERSNSAAPARANPQFRSPKSEVSRCLSSAAADESAAKHLFKLSHDVILSLDRVGNILCINQRGIQLSGYSESELRGANIFELLLLPEDRELAREMLADLLEGKARQYQVRWRTKVGAIVHFDGASVPRLSESGEFLSTLCTLRDVTERKSAEEKLRKSEEKYRDLIEISPDAIYVVDANGICVLGNRAAAELAGIPLDQLVGAPFPTPICRKNATFFERGSRN